MRHIRGSASLPVTVLAVFVVFMLVACAMPSQPEGDLEHAATVEALLPTAEPTVTVAPQVNAAPTPTESPVAATDTPIPATSTQVPPTYTPRPLPTYTPRPIPLPGGGGERSAATPFHAQALDGTDLVLTDTFGTPTLLAFWAPW